MKFRIQACWFAFISVLGVIYANPNAKESGAGWSDQAATAKELLKQGHYAQAITYYEKAIDKKAEEASQQDNTLGQLYNQVGLCYDALGQANEALIPYGLALEIFEENKCQNRYVGIVYINSARMQMQQRLFDKALANYQKGIAILQNYFHPSHTVLCEVQLGYAQAHYHKRAYSEAIALCNAIIEHRKVLKKVCDKPLLEAYKMLLHIYSITNKHAEAEKLFEGNQSILEACLGQGKLALADMYYEVAMLLPTSTKKNNLRLALLAKAFAIYCESTGVSLGKKVSVGDRLSDAYRDAEDYDKAAEPLEKVHGILAQCSDACLLDKACCSFKWAQVLYKQKEFSEAITKTKEAIEYFELLVGNEGRDETTKLIHQQLVESYRLLLKIYLQQKAEQKTIEDAFAKAEKYMLAYEGTYKEQLVEMYVAMTAFYDEKEQYKKAYDCISKAIKDARNKSRHQYVYTWYYRVAYQLAYMHYSNEAKKTITCCEAALAVAPNNKREISAEDRGQLTKIAHLLGKVYKKVYEANKTIDSLNKTLSAFMQAYYFLYPAKELSSSSNAIKGGEAAPQHATIDLKDEAHMYLDAITFFVETLSNERCKTGSEVTTYQERLYKAIRCFFKSYQALSKGETNKEKEILAEYNALIYGQRGVAHYWQGNLESENGASRKARELYGKTVKYIDIALARNSKKPTLTNGQVKLFTKYQTQAKEKIDSQKPKPLSGWGRRLADYLF